MDIKYPLLDAGRKALAALSLKGVAIDPALKHIEAEDGRVYIDLYRGEKISKAVFSAIEIHSMSVAEQSIIIWPDDPYDFPVFWCNLTQMPGMSFFIFDFMPVMDIVVWPEYGEKYLLGLVEMKANALEKLGDGVAEKHFDLSSLAGWAFSPYRTLFRLTEEGVAHIDPVVQEYGQAYVKLWQEAAPIHKTEEAAFCKRKKAAVRKIMAENDPGHPLMLGVFGEEKTEKVFEIVF